MLLYGNRRQVEDCGRYTNEKLLAEKLDRADWVDRMGARGLCLCPKDSTTKLN